MYIFQINTFLYEENRFIYVYAGLCAHSERANRNVEQ